MPRSQGATNNSPSPSLSYWSVDISICEKLGKKKRETAYDLLTNLPTADSFTSSPQIHNSRFSRLGPVFFFPGSGALLTMKSMMTFMNQSLKAICRQVCLRWWKIETQVVEGCGVMPYPYPFPISIYTYMIVYVYDYIVCKGIKDE